VDIKMPPNGTVQEQNQILENLLTQGYNGIAISPKAPKDQVAELNKAAAKTILICHDSDAPNSNRKLYIGTNNFEPGSTGPGDRQAASQGAERWRCSWNALGRQCARGSAALRSRSRAKTLKSWRRKRMRRIGQARVNVENVINDSPISTCSGGLLVLQRAADRLGNRSQRKKGKILAAVFDGDDGTLEGIEKGVVQVTVVQKPFEFGYLSSKYLHELNTKGDAAMPKNPIMDLGVERITPENVKEFKQRMAELKK